MLRARVDRSWISNRGEFGKVIPEVNEIIDVFFRSRSIGRFFREMAHVVVVFSLFSQRQQQRHRR